MYAIYARQSVDRPDSISIESQVEFCQYEVRGEAYRVYTDKGYSGKNTDRPQFKALIEDIKKGVITKVVVYKLDRISRSILDFSNMMVLFQKYGVEFISSTERFDTSTPMGRAMLNICIVFAQLERETIQKRVTDAYLSRSQKGFYMGGRVAYGFELAQTSIQGVKTSMYVINPAEAEQVRLMYEMYADPFTSYGDIIKYLHEHNMMNLRKGQSWNRSRIGYLLKNPAYVQADLDVYEFFKENDVEIVNDASDFIGTNGCYYYMGQNSKGKKHVTLPGNILVLAPHEGFIPSDLWLACRKKCLKNKQIQPTHKGTSTWLVGKVKCLHCGYALSRKNFHNSPRQAYFFCTHRMNTKNCQGPGTIYADEFEQKIYSQIREKLKEFETLTGCETPNDNPKATTLRIQLSQVQAEIEKLLDSISSADETLLGYINKRVSELDTQKQTVQKELSKLEQDKRLTRGQIQEISGYLDHWDELTLNDKRLVCDSLILRIDASSEKTVIHWKY